MQFVVKDFLWKWKACRKLNLSTSESLQYMCTTCTRPSITPPPHSPTDGGTMQFSSPGSSLNFKYGVCNLQWKIVSFLTSRIEFKFDLDKCGHRDEAETSVPWENSYWWRTKPLVTSGTGLLTTGPTESSLRLQLELYMDLGGLHQMLGRHYRLVIWNRWKVNYRKIWKILNLWRTFCQVVIVTVNSGGAQNGLSFKALWNDKSCTFFRWKNFTGSAVELPPDGQTTERLKRLDR